MNMTNAPKEKPADSSLPQRDDDIAPFEHIGDIAARIVDRLRDDKDEAA